MRYKERLANFSIVIANQLFAKSWRGNLPAYRLLRLRQLTDPRNDGIWTRRLSCNIDSLSISGYNTRLC